MSAQGVGEVKTAKVGVCRLKKELGFMQHAHACHAFHGFCGVGAVHRLLAFKSPARQSLLPVEVGSGQHGRSQLACERAELRSTHTYTHVSCEGHRGA